MCAKGTAKKSAADIEQLAQAHAIQLSAFTGRELISVEAKCLANEVPKGLLKYCILLLSKCCSCIMTQCFLEMLF